MLAFCKTRTKKCESLWQDPAAWMWLTGKKDPKKTSSQIILTWFFSDEKGVDGAVTTVVGIPCLNKR